MIRNNIGRYSQVRALRMRCPAIYDGFRDFYIMWDRLFKYELNIV